MRAVWTIARMSILENSRKQVFQVTCLLMLAVIGGSTLLSVLTEGVKLKILKDLCMSCILFGGAVLSITIASTGIPNDVENRTVYPVFARPIGRFVYVMGKFLGAFLTVAIGTAAMAAAFGILIASYEGHFDWYLLLAIGFALIESAVICAVATAISTTASPAVTASLTFVLYIFGAVKIGYVRGLIDRLPDAVQKTVMSVFYHLLPNLECFNLKAALVHHDPIPASYLVQVALYGFCYTAFVLAAGSVRFARREV
jgi:ABC-type transport system involved in multi-copper enzyme maturation permease subunit